MSLFHPPRLDRQFGRSTRQLRHRLGSQMDAGSREFIGQSIRVALDAGLLRSDSVRRALASSSPSARLRGLNRGWLSRIEAEARNRVAELLPEGFSSEGSCELVWCQGFLTLDFYQAAFATFESMEHATKGDQVAVSTTVSLMSEMLVPFPEPNEILSFGTYVGSSLEWVLEAVGAAVDEGCESVADLEAMRASNPDWTELPEDPEVLEMLLAIHNNGGELPVLWYMPRAVPKPVEQRLQWLIRYARRSMSQGPWKDWVLGVCLALEGLGPAPERDREGLSEFYFDEAYSVCDLIFAFPTRTMAMDLANDMWHAVQSSGQSWLEPFSREEVIAGTPGNFMARWLVLASWLCRAGEIDESAPYRISELAAQLRPGQLGYG